MLVRRWLTTAAVTAALVAGSALTADAAPPPPTPTLGVAEARAEVVVALMALDRATTTSGLLSVNSPSTASRARPDGWWGWTQCLGTVAAWTASNAFVAAKIATLAKKAGSLRRAIQKAQAKVGGYPKSKKRWAAIALIGGVGTEISGIGGVVAACF